MKPKLIIIIIACAAIASCAYGPEGKPSGVDWIQVNQGLDAYERVKEIRNEK